LCSFAGNSLGKTVIEDIIPAVSILRQRHQITYPLMFSMEFLVSNRLPPTVEASDLERSDEFFDKITLMRTRES
jgi:hypothetical protein